MNSIAPRAHVWNSNVASVAVSAVLATAYNPTTSADHTHSRRGSDPTATFTHTDILSHVHSAPPVVTRPVLYTQHWERVLADIDPVSGFEVPPALRLRMLLLLLMCPGSTRVVSGLRCTTCARGRSQSRGQELPGQPRSEPAQLVSVDPVSLETPHVHTL